MYEQALLLLVRVRGQTDAIFVIFGGVLAEPVEQVYNLSHQFFLYDVMVLLMVFVVVEGLFLAHAHLQDFVLDSVEAPEGQDDEVATLRVPATYFVYQLMVFVVDFEFLEFFSQAAAVQNGAFDDFSHVLVM